MRVLFMGDITGERVARGVAVILPELRRRLSLDLIIANADNCAITGSDPVGGSGARVSQVLELFAGGADIVSLCSHSFDGPEAAYVHAVPKVLRPMNAPAGSPGRGIVTLNVGDDEVTVISLAASDSLAGASDLSAAYAALGPRTGTTIIHLVSEIHTATVFAHAVDGEIAALFATMSHDPAPRLSILPKGTGFSPATGMVGATGGVGGFSPERFIARLRGEEPAKQPAYAHTDGPLAFDAVVFELTDRQTTSVRWLSDLVPEITSMLGEAMTAASPTVSPPPRDMQPDTVRLGVLTDLHVDPDGAASPPRAFHNAYRQGGPEQLLIRQAAGDIEQAGAAVTLVLGDLAEAGDRASMASALNLIGRAKTYAVPGNHDIGLDEHSLRNAITSLDDPNISYLPAQAAQLSGNIHLVGLPLCRGAQSLALPSFDVFSEELLLLASHYPLLHTRGRVEAAGYAHPDELADVERVLALLSARQGPTVILHGHLHLRSECETGPILQLGFAALVEPPHEASVLDIAGANGQYALSRSSWSVASHPETRIPVLTPSRTFWRFSDGRWTGHTQQASI